MHKLNVSESILPSKQQGKILHYSTVVFLTKITTRVQSYRFVWQQEKLELELELYDLLLSIY
jgi:hypothetical protein